MGAEDGGQARRVALASLRVQPEAPEGRSHRPRVLAAVGIVAVSALGGFGWGSSKLSEARDRVPPPAPVLASSAAQPVLQATGYVTARRRATLSAPVHGELVAIPVGVGDKVERGQTLARVDDAGVRAQWELARAELKAAHSAQRETEVRLADSSAELRRHTRLAAAGVLSEAARTSARSEVDAQRARLEHQRDNIGVAHRRAAYWKGEVERRRVRAPFAGVVVSKDAEVGEAVAPAAEPARFARVGLLTLIDMTSLEVEVDVNETQIGSVAVGQFVDVTLDAFPADTLPARVSAVEPVADRRRATVRVRVLLDKQDPRLRPEMGVRVAFGSVLDVVEAR